LDRECPLDKRFVLRLDEAANSTNLL